MPMMRSIQSHQFCFVFVFVSFCYVSWLDCFYLHIELNGMINKSELKKDRKWSSSCARAHRVCNDRGVSEILGISSCLRTATRYRRKMKFIRILGIFFTRRCSRMWKWRPNFSSKQNRKKYYIKQYRQLNIARRARHMDTQFTDHNFQGQNG